MGEFSSVAGDNRLVGIVVVAVRDNLVEDGDDEDRSLPHAGLGLAEDVMALQSERDALDLHLTGMFEPALANGPLEFVLEEELVPASEIGSLVLFGRILLGLLIVGALILRHNVSHLSLLLNTI